jgi:hypothetical protein
LSFNSKELGLIYYNNLVNKNKSICSRIYKYLQKNIYIYLFIDRLYKIIIYFLHIRYYKSSSARSISSFKKSFFLGISISHKIIVFCPLYFFYIIIIIFLFHDLIKIRVLSRIRAFGTSITSLIIIIVYNKNNRKSGSLVLFHDLLRT